MELITPVLKEKNKRPLEITFLSYFLALKEYHLLLNPRWKGCGERAAFHPSGPTPSLPEVVLTEKTASLGCSTFGKHLQRLPLAAQIITNKR